MGAFSDATVVVLIMLGALISLLVILKLSFFLYKRFGQRRASDEDLRWIINYRELNNINRNTRPPKRY